MKTLVIVLIMSLLTPCTTNKIETTGTCMLITYADGTGYYIGE